MLSLPPNEEYKLLREIVQGAQYAEIPLSFSLKMFLGWDDVLIKKFLKERKKLIKLVQKRNAELKDKCCGGVCGGDVGTCGGTF